MFLLTRTVRFAINPGLNDSADWGPAHNSFAAFPSARRLSVHYELEIACKGELSPRTGYLVNIKQIDFAARNTVIPHIDRAFRRTPDKEPGNLLAEALPALSSALSGGVHSVRWLLSPLLSVEVETANMRTALLRQQFEFAASHRLHNPALSDDENQRAYGKCNSPNGHGHNYRIEPCVAIPVGGSDFDLAVLERLVHDLLIDRFDHKHLNEDTREFSAQTGVIPSVENIAKVCFDILKPAIAAAAGPAVALQHVTVWETDKTRCRYPA